MQPLRLIMSGAAVDQELAAEFGPLPPAFLPVGTQRLYELQLQALAGAGPVHLVLPESFEVPEHDARRLGELDVRLVLIPDGLRLAEAVLYAINSLGVGDAPVHLLHGDTLIEGAPLNQDDVFVAGPRRNEYAWAEMALGVEGRVLSLQTSAAGDVGHEGWPIAAGYFSFSSALALVRSLTRARGDFISALNDYVGEHEVRMAGATRWLDFGHVQTFFQSRLAVTTARAFNTVRIDGMTAHKSSGDADKIRAEARWLETAPPQVQVYSARLICSRPDDDPPSYETEYEFLPVLSELYVYGALPRQSWLRILASCEAFLSVCATHRGNGSGDEALRELCVTKTLGRLERYGRETGFRIDQPLRYQGRPVPSLVEIAERVAPALQLQSGRSTCVMHGDLCFSNLLYDSRVRRIKALDPRGMVNGDTTLYGDVRYDLAKLAHSIVGRYDQIIAGRCIATEQDGAFTLTFEDLPAQEWLEDALADMSVDGVGGLSEPVRAGMTTLFLSMLPLHADRPDRQRAMVANALRLYAEAEAA